MRKILSVALLWIAFPAMAQQQSKIQTDRENFFRFGGKAGVNINKITGQTYYKSGFNYNYQLGGFVQINFSNRFGIQPEVNFVQSSSEFTNDGTSVFDDLFRGGKQKNAALNRLEIPLLLNINVGESKHVKFQVGPAFSAILNQKKDSLANGGNIYKNTDLSAVGGLWIQLPLINIGARYKLGFTNINALNNSQTWKSQAIQVFVGVTF